MWRRLELSSACDWPQVGKVFQRRLSGFAIIPTSLQSLPHFTILCTTYTRGDRLIQPGLHNPRTYFYPYDHAVPDVRSLDENRAELKFLDVRFVVIHPLSGYGEQDACSKLWTELIGSYRTRPELVFTSSDSKHRIYALSQE